MNAVRSSRCRIFMFVGWQIKHGSLILSSKWLHITDESAGIELSEVRTHFHRYRGVHGMGRSRLSDE